VVDVLRSRPDISRPGIFAILRAVLPCLALIAAFLPAIRAEARGFAIDPDPNSPLLGDLLDRETRASHPAPVQAAPQPRVRATPVVPREAVTVLVPGRKLKHPAGGIR
jgi:hypothetical protein